MKSPREFLSLKLEPVDIHCAKNSEKVKFNRQTKFTSRYASYNTD